MEVSEQIIIRHLKAGDARAWRWLYAHHYGVLCRMANDYLGDPFLAESIVEDVIFHFWEIRETVDIQTSLRAYLMRAVRNRCLNHFASKQEQYETSFSELPLESLDASLFFRTNDEHPLGCLLEKELEEQIIRAVESIPSESRQVFRKSRYERKKNDEIAAELGISVNTVKYHIKRALAILREYLGEYLTLFVGFLFLNTHGGGMA